MTIIIALLIIILRNFDTREIILFCIIFVQAKRTFSDIRPMCSVCAVPGLTGRVSAGRCRRGGPRCAGIATTGSVGAMTSVESCKTPVGFIPKVTLRPDCKTHHTLLQRRLGE